MAVVEGCVATGTGLIAYGEKGTAGRAPHPALWSSTTGTTWQPLSPSFTGTTGNGPVGPQSVPLTQIATGASAWLAVSGAGDLPDQTWPAPVGGEAALALVTPGLWASADGGTDWQQLAATGPPFSASGLGSQADAALLVGAGASPMALVAGSRDGQLALWAGSPAAS